MPHAAHDPRFLDGIACFNRRAFFQAHEVWEDLWREEQGPSRQFYKGLIQLAVCLHHFSRGNLHGTRKLCLSGSAYLEPYRPVHLDVDLDRLLIEMRICCREALVANQLFPRVKLDPRLIPTIVTRDTRR